MNVDEILTETFTDHERLAPDAADVLRNIRAELDRGRRQHLVRLAPVLIAAMIIAVALTLFARDPFTGRTAQPVQSPQPAQSSPPTVASDPEAAAHASARAILRDVPLPPGAHRSDSEPGRLKNGPSTSLSSSQAKASGVWLAPGTVPATIAFARTQPASGFTPRCTCGGTSLKWVTFFNTDQSREYNFVIAPYGTGVAIKITVVVPWVPTRPQWTYVADTATSVDVTVQRVRQSGSVGGAPTVRRTLTAQATRRLAAVANGLDSQAPSLCLGPAIAVAATDTLVFHEPTRTITFTVAATNCPQIKVDVAGEDPAYLDVGALDTSLLHELGLPPEYGH